MDRCDGGAVIPCKFTLFWNDPACKKVTDYLTHELDELTFQGKEKLDIKQSSSADHQAHGDFLVAIYKVVTLAVSNVYCNTQRKR